MELFDKLVEFELILLLELLFVAILEDIDGDGIELAEAAAAAEDSNEFSNEPTIADMADSSTSELNISSRDL